MTQCWPSTSCAAPICSIWAVGRQEGRAAAQVRQTIRESGQESRIVAVGEVPHDQMAVLYRNAAAVLLPALYEGFGLAALEAMACGAPVIASPAALPVAEAGLAIESDDPAAWAAGLATVLGD